jgi:hypothetical protein
MVDRPPVLADEVVTTVDACVAWLSAR